MFGLSKKKRAYAEVVSQKIGCVMASQQDQVNVILDLMVEERRSKASQVKLESMRTAQHLSREDKLWVQALFIQWKWAIAAGLRDTAEEVVYSELMKKAEQDFMKSDYTRPILDFRNGKLITYYLGILQRCHLEGIEAQLEPK